MSRWIDVDEFKAFLSEVRARYNLFSDEERPRYEAYSKALYILNEYLEDAPSVDLVHCGECELKRLCDNAGGVDDWNYCYWGRRMKGTDDEER